MTSQALLDQAQQASQSIVTEVEEQFLPLDEAVLRHRPAQAQWNALDCLEHLSLTYDHYLPRIKAAIQQATPQSAREEYKSGWLGRQAIQAMQPREGGTISFKMKAFARIVPRTDDYPAEEILRRFIAHQESFEQLAQEARTVSLNKVRVITLAGPLVRLRLGDCFRFLLAHDQRHLLQARRAIKNKA